MCAQVLESLQDGASHDALVSCAGYILGEYGRLVPEVPTHVQFALLQERFPVVSSETKVCFPAEFLCLDSGSAALKSCVRRQLWKKFVAAHVICCFRGL